MTHKLNTLCADSLCFERCWHTRSASRLSRWQPVCHLLLPTPIGKDTHSASKVSNTFLSGSNSLKASMVGDALFEVPANSIDENSATRTHPLRKKNTRNSFAALHLISKTLNRRDTTHR